MSTACLATSLVNERNCMNGSVKSNPLGVNPFDRVQVLVDAQNLIGMLRGMGKKMDYKLFLAFLRDNARLVRLSYFVVQKQEADKRSEGVLDMVEYAGYDVLRKTGYEIHDSNGYYRFKGSVVGEMTVGLVKAADAGIDHIILITGDGDLYAGIEEAKNRGARVTLISDNESVNDDIRRACDAFINITDLPESLFFE